MCTDARKCAASAGWRSSSRRNGVADPCGHRLAEPLALVVDAAVAAAEPGGAPELVEQRPPFLSRGSRLVRRRRATRRGRVRRRGRRVDGGTPPWPGHRGPAGASADTNASVAKAGGGNVDIRVGDEGVQVAEAFGVRHPGFDAVEHQGPHVVGRAEHVRPARRRCQRPQPLDDRRESPVHARTRWSTRSRFGRRGPGHAER